MKRNFIYSFILFVSVLSAGVVFGQTPLAPSGLTASKVPNTTTSLALSWTDNSTNETGFDVEMALSPGGPFSFKTSVAANATSVVINGLTANTSYSFQVKAYNGSSVSTPSNVATQTTNVELPNPVTGVSVLNVQQTSALVAWTDNTSGASNETGFQILRSSGGGFVPLTTVGANVTTFQDNTLLPDNIYQYRIIPFNATGFNLLYPGTSGVFFTLPATPATPIATLSGLTTVNLSWYDSSVTETSTIIERSGDGGKTWSWVGSTAKDISFFTDNNAQEGITYFYRIRFRNGQGESPNSGLAIITTKKRVAPEAIYELTAKTVSTTQIDLAWGLPIEDVTNKRVAIEIWRYTEDAAFAEQIAVIEPHFFSYSDKTCKPKTKYIYVVHATNYQGKSGPSNAATAVTLGPPYAPTNVVVEAKTDAIGTPVLGVTWKDNSTDEWGFTVERSTDKDFKTVFSADVVENVTSLTSTPIEEGVTYYFRVKGSNKYGDSKYSDVVTITTAVTAAPNAPYALKGTAKAEEVTLMWGDDSNKEETFEVERSTDGTTFAKVGTTARNVVTYVDATAKEKTKYSYRVKAVNSKGSSAYSNVLEITTPAKAVLVAQSTFDVASDAIEVLEVYPNPTADYVKVSLPKSSKGTISVIDRLNREVSRVAVSENQEEVKIDLTNLPEGAYTLSISTGSTHTSKRVYKY